MEPNKNIEKDYETNTRVILKLTSKKKELDIKKKQVTWKNRHFQHENDELNKRTNWLNTTRFRTKDNEWRD